MHRSPTTIHFALIITCLALAACSENFPAEIDTSRPMIASLEITPDSVVLDYLTAEETEFNIAIFDSTGQEILEHDGLNASPHVFLTALDSITIPVDTKHLYGTPFSLGPGCPGETRITARLAHINDYAVDYDVSNEFTITVLPRDPLVFGTPTLDGVVSPAEWSGAEIFEGHILVSRDKTDNH